MTKLINKINILHIKQELIKRLLRSIIIEELLPCELKNQELIIHLKRTRKKIVVLNIKSFKLGKIQILGDVILFTKQHTKTVNDINYLLNVIYDELKDELNPMQWNCFVEEINNCNENDIFVKKYIQNFNQELQKKITAANKNTLLEYVAECYSQPEQLIFFERWAARGHPYHPCHKTKLGFNQKAYRQYSPEFCSDVAISVAAIKKSAVILQGETADFDYENWFKHHYPDVLENYYQQLANEKLSRDDYYPIFIHPWQYQHVITQLFSNEITNRNLVLLKNIVQITKPSLSFRTMIPTDRADMPHIKLPVAVHSTSAMRTISKASIQNGPAISNLLSTIFAREPTIAKTIRLANEFCGLHINHPVNDIAKHLGVIYRKNPFLHLNKGDLGIVVAALFEKSPINNKPLFVELIGLTGEESLQHALNYFDHYCRIVLEGYLDLYLIYGIALEGHQQNTLAVFENYLPKLMIARDLGGLRINKDVLAQKKYSLNEHPDSATVTDDNNEVTNKFLHTVIQYHLGEIALMLANYFQTQESQFWAIIKNNVVKRFNAVKHCVSTARWQEEYHVILEQDWNIKSLMRMRLSNTYCSYLYVKHSNPLRDL